MMQTDYYRIREHLNLMENSILKLKKLLKLGGREAIEMETQFLKSNYNVLLYIKNTYSDTIFDTRIDGLEKEAKELLNKFCS